MEILGEVDDRDLEGTVVLGTRERKRSDDSRADIDRVR